MEQRHSYKPTAAFVGASWAALFVGVLAYLLGLWNAPQMLRNEKGYYLAMLLLGLFSAVSLQKAVRDRTENIPVTGTYFGICWIAFGAAIVLLSLGLWNATTITRSEKGFYAMAYVLSLFASAAVQKNVRDTAMTTDTGFASRLGSSRPTGQ